MSPSIPLGFDLIYCNASSILSYNSVDEIYKILGITVFSFLMQFYVDFPIYYLNSLRES